MSCRVLYGRVTGGFCPKIRVGRVVRVRPHRMKQSKTRNLRVAGFTLEQDPLKTLGYAMLGLGLDLDPSVFLQYLF